MCRWNTSLASIICSTEDRSNLGPDRDTFYIRCQFAAMSDDVEAKGIAKYVAVFVAALLAINAIEFVFERVASDGLSTDLVVVVLVLGLTVGLVAVFWSRKN